MTTITPCFPALFDFLRTQRPVRRTSQIDQELARLRDCSILDLEQVFQEQVPPSLLNCQRAGPNSRERVYSTRITFWAFLCQVLSPGSSCREAVRKVQAHLGVDQQEPMSGHTSAYCQARDRFSKQTLQTIHDRIVEHLEESVGSDQLWRGRPVKIVDGTTVSMPDTPLNQSAYPQPGSQKPGCGFPVMKIVALFSLATGAILSVFKGTLQVHECQLFRQLWSFLKRGDIVLGDRAFCSYQAINLLKQNGVDSVFRLHQRRKSDFRAGRRLGQDDHLIFWQKPRQKTPTMSRQDFQALDRHLELRELKIMVQIKGFRTKSILLVTTLLDPVLYPKQALADLFLRRWKAELFLRDIKVTLGMDVLRCLSPKMVLKELQMHLMAYNLIRSLMLQAACTHQVELSRLSFKGSVDTLRQWSGLIHSARHHRKKQNRLIDTMLYLIATDLLPLRPHRSEPRAVKRRPKPFQLLTKPRHLFKEIPHRSKYRKSALS